MNKHNYVGIICFNEVWNELELSLTEPQTEVREKTLNDSMYIVFWPYYLIDSLLINCCQIPVDISQNSMHCVFCLI